ncbi:MAG TPA: stress response translation initiation inhibitor YciH [Myxococcales bacterium]|jgi:translation initiation factor 1|nr:stress response translation initiation inhibitor YciH [Myxococcales bacterium]
MAKRETSRTVYSSELGRMCAHCGLPASRCQCRANPRGRSGGQRSSTLALSNPESDGFVRVGRSSRGRGGKTVTLVEGVQLSGTELRELARDLKRHCGTGGALKEDTIEIQGDQRDALVKTLEERGFRVKRKGG